MLKASSYSLVTAFNDTGLSIHDHSVAPNISVRQNEATSNSYYRQMVEAARTFSHRRTTLYYARKQRRRGVYPGSRQSNPVDAQRRNDLFSIAPLKGQKAF
jgi:hypothetical protein